MLSSAKEWLFFGLFVLFVCFILIFLSCFVICVCILFFLLIFLNKEV